MSRHTVVPMDRARRQHPARRPAPAPPAGATVTVDVDRPPPWLRTLARRPVVDLDLWRQERDLPF